MSENNWADNGEDDFFDMVSNDIEVNKEKKLTKIKEAKDYIIKLFNNINVDFEPEVVYRGTVKNIIRGLVLCQLFKQRTISLYREGKEDREYLGSFMMYQVQKYLHNNIKVTEWNAVLTDVYNYFKPSLKSKSNDLPNAVVAKVNINKIITESILLATLLNNKKEYIKRKHIEPPVY
tara:strand:+ start:3334 stop:3864 length:531 start_codon:yes stop_codon:yes gene_type:complete